MKSWIRAAKAGMAGVENRERLPAVSSLGPYLNDVYTESVASHMQT